MRHLTLHLKETKFMSAEKCLLFCFPHMNECISSMSTRLQIAMIIQVLGLKAHEKISLIMILIQSNWPLNASQLHDHLLYKKGIIN